MVSRCLVRYAAVTMLTLAAALATSASPATCTVEITVDGVSNSRGVIGALVFNSNKGWPERVSAAFRSRAVPAHRGVTKLAIEDLPVGTYAVVVLHDENRNMKLDRNWLGLPKEQWGMSENPRASFSAPTFQGAKFTLSHDLQLHVELR